MVLLPAPFGPEVTEDLAALDAEIHVDEARTPLAVGLRKAGVSIAGASATARS